MDLDLASILQQTSDVAGQLSDAGAQVSSVITQGNQINEARVRNANEAADAASVKTQAELGEVARQEASRKAIAARIGTDPSLAGWVIGQSADISQQAAKDMYDASEAIRQKDSVSFLTNPLGWIAGQLTVNTDIANYNDAERRKKIADDNAKSAFEMTRDSFQTSNALSSTTTEAYVSAMKVLGSYQYNQQATEAAMQGARWNMEGIVASANLSREKLSVMYSANSAIMQEKQYQNELSRLRLANAEFDLHKQAFAEKKDEDSLILKYIQDGYFAQTGKQMDGLSAKNAVILFKNKADDRVQSYFKSGLDSNSVTNNDGTRPVFSISPFESSDLVGRGRILNMSPAMQQVGDQLVTWRNQFQSPAVQNQFPHDPKDKKSIETAFNSFVEQQKKLSLSNVQQGSVFAPASPDQVAKLNKDMAALPVWKNVLEPASRTGVSLSDPNVVIGLVNSAMSEGKVSYQDASDLSLMYASGLEINNQSRNFLAFGLPKVLSYNAAISVPGTFGKTTINLSDSKTFSTILNKMQAYNAMYKMQGGNPDAGRNPTFNQPDMNVTSDINNFPLQYGPKINSKQPEVKSTKLYGQ